MPYQTDVVVISIFSFFVVVQLFYYLFFFSRLAFYKEKKTPVTEPTLPISIVICAFNEEANLVKNLPLWLGQQYHRQGTPFYEVLVVNDNSQDDTFYFLNRMQQQYENLHVVNLTQEAKLIPGKKFPLSMGIKSARFENLLLTDADCVPSSEFWLAGMAAGFSSEKKIVLGYSPYLKHKGWLNKTIRFETVHSAIQYMSFALAGIPYMGVGRNLAYTRNLFNTNKGFSSHHHLISGDDDLFINQVATSKNTTISLSPETMTFSEPKKTAEEWHYQKKRHLSTGKHYKTKHKILLGTYAMSHFMTWVSFIACVFFPKIWMFAGIAFVLRWLVQWFMFQASFSKLNEKELINYIWVFDIWLLFYHIRSIPSIFFKNKIHWK
jgi:glycosyltransferase involved in cell wall biosynthesis